MMRAGSARGGRRAASLAFIVLAVLVACAAWWWTHATVLDERLTAAGFDMAPRPVEKATLHVMVAIPEPHGDADETLTFRGVDLSFARNTAHATARLSVCSPRDHTAIVGSVVGSLTPYCHDVRRVEPGTTIRWRDGQPPVEYLVLTMEPSRPGMARIDRIEVDYSRGRAHLWQWGTARAAADITMRAS